jgi:regulator of sigma E protease
MNALVSFLIGLLSIAGMITIHETGHFVFARLSGITVEVFAIGWGKPLITWRRGSTEYRINFFPLGGYCRLKGADDLRQSLEQQYDHITSNPGSLFALSPLRRIPTFLAGALFNLIGAFILFIPLQMIDYERYGDPNIVVVTSEYPELFSNENGTENAAARAGIQTGDTIIALDGKPVSYFPEIQEILANAQRNTAMRFTVVRDGKQLEFSVVPDYHEEQRRPIFGLTSYIEPVVTHIAPLSPEASVLREGDRIRAVYDTPVAHTLDVMQALRRANNEVQFTVTHPDGSTEQVSYIPEKDSLGKSQFQFSFERPIITVSGDSFLLAIGHAAQQTITAITQTISLIPELFTSRSSDQGTIAGPLRISYMIGEMRNAGLRAMLHLLAMVSISLAVANLLPIPGLDGGSIAMSLYEAIRGKPVQAKIYARFQMVGLALLVLLMILVITSDIRFLLGGM